MNVPDYVPRLVDRLLDDLLLETSAVMLVGPRACGKTTMASQRAKTVVKLDAETQAAAFVADPDAALRGMAEPVLLDEWQAVPGVLGAARRAIDADPRPNRSISRAPCEPRPTAGYGPARVASCALRCAR